MPSIGQTWVFASIGAVVEMGVLSTLKRLLMESNLNHAFPFLGQKHNLIILRYLDEENQNPTLIFDQLMQMMPKRVFDTDDKP
jgi:hypothetical protein